MDTRLLKVFLAIAKQGGLVKAARSVHLTPSALSHGLRVLELEMGCRLFDRGGSGMTLNQAGEQLMAGVEGPIAAIDRATLSVKELSRWGHTRIRVGAAASLCQHFLPKVIAAMNKEIPKLQLVLENGNMPELTRQLRARQIDVAIGVEDSNEADLESRALFEDELLFTFAENHHWNSSRPLTKEEIRKQPLILSSREAPSAKRVLRYLEDCNISPLVAMEVRCLSAIKELVKLNLGVAVLAPWVADLELSLGQLKMRPLGGKVLRRHWVVAYLKTRKMGHVEEVFIHTCRNQSIALRKSRTELLSS